MSPDLIGAQSLWLVPYIKKRLAVGGEHKIRARIVDTLIDNFAGRNRSHKDAEITTAGEIDSECDARVVGAHIPRAELVVLPIPNRERGDIEDDFFWSRQRILPAHDGRILSALGEATLIEI